MSIHVGGPVKPKALSNEELRNALLRLARDERTLAGDMLRHLMEADARRVAGEWGFDSL